jgi:hypothetical protein
MHHLFLLFNLHPDYLNFQNEDVVNSEDVVGHNRSAVVVESDVVMSNNVESYKTVK